MIIIAQSLYFILRSAWRWYCAQERIATAKRLEVLQRIDEAAAAMDTLPLDPEECFTFAVPVYRQRYSTVQDVLLDARWAKTMRTVVDFGCAEFGFFQYLKHMATVTRVLAVDIDEELLKDNMIRVQPLTADYLGQRSKPLVVEILRGSIADPDWRLKTVDAIVGIEIIEHLYPDTLDALPYNVFGYAKPKVAIFTTPNADFNVLFPNFKGFRHDDHKFEWTREQFEAWATHIVRRFPDYSVTFAGIGAGPKGTESLGCCSQMAVFVKQYDVVGSEVPEQLATAVSEPNSTSFGVCTYFSHAEALMSLMDDDLFDLRQEVSSHDCDIGGDAPPALNRYYKRIDVVRYPYTVDERTADERILHQATYQILRHATLQSRFYNYETGAVEIPIADVCMGNDGPFATESQVVEILRKANFKIEECVVEEEGVSDMRLCVRYDLEMDGSSSKTGSEYAPQRDDLDDEADAEGVPHGSDASGAHYQRNINSSVDSDWEVEEERAERTAPAGGKETEAATPSDPLVDSGYQKSLSNAEWSPQSPIDGHFDEQFALTKIDINDIKDSIKARMAQSQNGKHMNNRLVSEWRRFSGGGPTHHSAAAAAAAATVKAVRPATAGGSSDSSSKRRRKSHSVRSDGEDSDSTKEDVRSIADVLMYNSLNKLNVDEEAAAADVPLPAPVERPQELELPQLFIVENGDLANNNRDNEGNNYPEIDAAHQVHAAAEDDINENVDVVLVEMEAAHNHEENEDQENRNVRIHPLIEYIEAADDGIVADAPPPPAAAQPAPQVAHQPEPHVLEIIDVHSVDEGLNHASREALFDPNSQVDMLDDMGSITDENADFDTEETDATDGEMMDVVAHQPPPQGSNGVVFQEPVIPDNNPFPNWLLQLFGGPYGGGGVVLDGDEYIDPVDEAHYYCQGDGLGVHPSVVEVDDDTDSSDSSSTDAAQAERTISEDDVGSLPRDAVSLLMADAPAAGSSALEVIGLPIVLLDQQASNASNDSGAEEFYDTIDDDDVGDTNNNNNNNNDDVPRCDN